ncbi:MAG: Crp/Fnr family transcriptional regulator [Thermodesulfobacteriota bacterium]
MRLVASGRSDHEAIAMHMKERGLVAFRHVVQSLADVPDEEWELFARQVRNRVFETHDLLIRAGEPVTDFFFLVSGFVRFFYLTGDGKEFNKAFAQENQFVGSFGAEVLKQPCRFSVQALERTEAMVIPVQVIRDGYDRHHSWERVGRMMAERVAVSKEIREGEFLLDSAETRYRRFLANYPSLADRISQYHVASYLGITDVALSRIRKKIGLTAASAKLIRD